MKKKVTKKKIVSKKKEKQFLDSKIVATPNLEKGGYDIIVHGIVPRDLYAIGKHLMDMAIQDICK